MRKDLHHALYKVLVVHKPGPHDSLGQDTHSVSDATLAEALAIHDLT